MRSFIPRTVYVIQKIRRFFRFGNTGYLFVLPALLYMLAFVGYPIISNFILSVQDVTVTTINAPTKDFVGFENYRTLLEDEVLITSIRNTFIFTIACLIFQFLIGFALALFFNKDFPFAKPLRGLLMIPWMIPMTVSGLMFKFMFSTNVGIINQLLQMSRVIEEPIEWLMHPGSAMFSLIATNTWIGIPFNMILLSTGLTTIPPELYEAAAIDGANKRQSFFKITVPLLKSAIEAVLILGFIYTFKVFDLVFVMTNGGPVNSTHLLSTYSYKLSFGLFKYSQGAATANILFIILFCVSIIYLKFVYNDKGTAA
ncbi:binding-protein-dependent transport systems inner membrane component [Sediminispirochaeta smaragdinae DSM 11293]|uniref:Binding-protein-dependent transport systems inner membrane component n=1 Tax=Sediminispirochaeta smaragdinae (strain DSM 11293 / JCM 15392 / SEBR 4228) TaxID=573413 RepID=E1RAJ4_SEDSS|nr:binding-protein-dependent transport systems inner membrane component [Sediminispirochaeta smaragdinae DSM 11293]